MPMNSGRGPHSGPTGPASAETQNRLGPDCGRGSSRIAGAGMATTPVGTYPGGLSSFSMFDCAGNVWEWCATKATDYEFKPYPYDIEEDEWSPEYLKGTSVRVLRGGSWVSVQLLARCASRERLDPNGRNDVNGFRVLVSPSL